MDEIAQQEQQPVAALVDPDNILGAFNQPNDDKVHIGPLPSISRIPQFRATHPDGRPTGFSDAVCNFNSHV